MSVDSPESNSELSARIHELIDDRLFQAFWNACEHFKTSDLVVYFDDRKDIDPVSIFKRETLIESAELSEALHSKLNKPARDANFNMTTSEAVFWFIPIFQDGEMACVAINAKRVGLGGKA